MLAGASASARWLVGSASDRVRLQPLAGKISDVVAARARIEPTQIVSELDAVGHNRINTRLLHSDIAKAQGSIELVLCFDPALLRTFFHAIQELNAAGLLLAYHDRSDGGLWATLCEMAFAGATGLDVDLEPLGGTPLAALFCEELGAVLQIRNTDAARVFELLSHAGLGDHCHALGRPNRDDRVCVRIGDRTLVDRARAELRGLWSETTRRMQGLRDDPVCAEEEHALRCDPTDPGRSVHVPFTFADVASSAPAIGGRRPRLAILREQGVNGQIEMAAAFDRAGFECVDVHMTDVLSGAFDLATVRGLAACGGFSYGDVLGAGEGWAKSILFSSRARDSFAAFFSRPETFTLGVCNGCQMLSNLHELIPGAEHWPRFVRNRSEQFEARLALVRIEPNPSVLLRDMQDARLPIVVSHGEGRAEFRDDAEQASADADARITLRYVDHRGRPTDHYPENPNGSPGGVAGVTSRDGRVTLTMPHPERIFRSVQHSWCPPEWGEDGPWMRLFRNARTFVA